MAVLSVRGRFCCNSLRRFRAKIACMRSNIEEAYVQTTRDHMLHTVACDRVVEHHLLIWRNIRISILSPHTRHQSHTYIMLDMLVPN